MKYTALTLALATASIGLNASDRVVPFTGKTDINSACGKIFPMAGTSLYKTTDSTFSASFALARQTELGDTHTHKNTREIYYCTEGNGVVHWGNQRDCPIKTDDILDIKPNIVHGLGSHSSVDVLVICLPHFTPEDYYTVDAEPKPGRDSARPDFYQAYDTSYKTIAIHPGLQLDRDTIAPAASYSPEHAELLFVLNGSCTFNDKDQNKVDLSRYYSAALLPSDTITAGDQGLEAIFASENK